jgi:hypothetical protein
MKICSSRSWNPIAWLVHQTVLPWTKLPMGRCIVCVLGVFLCAWSVTTPAQKEPNLMPDEVLHRVGKYAADNPNGNNSDFVKSLLPQVRTTGLNSAQEVALGMVYYFAFMPKEASEKLSKYLDRTDALGRVSWQADERMLAAAFQKDEEAERRIPEFRKRFKPIPEDLVYTQWLIWDAAEYHREKGEYDKAVKIMLEDLSRLPVDMPYQTFDVLGSQYECFKKAGQSETAVSLMKKHRDALRARLAKAGANTEQLAASKLSFDFAHKQGVEHFYYWLDGAADDDPRFDRGKVILRNAAIAVLQFDGWISQAEGGAETLK